jgi:methylmalonyl-CoA mutase cobalamin-binding subunit
VRAEGLMAVRRPRRALVVAVGSRGLGEASALNLIESLNELGVETVFIGSEECPSRIATTAASERADAVEVCLAGGAGVAFLRQLLRELIRVGRRDVSIVVHRV